ncbi:MAG TPA: hypothetical protein DCM28_18825 [Phycisphaerales bacterium]|nr:hypothetical protein [Phycisphaerales bacterium]HCD31578.1 hypothetical protein [Phycisphaerales bacterium]|tara:strand:- start:1212 stop:1859 length:648 start_codon:yes stop_codon:yes gene_type:complete
MPWSIAEIADAVEKGLKQQAQNDDVEQAVYGFDHHDELGLHPIVQDAIKQAGFGIIPEQRYPDDWHKRKKTHGQRCDIVLTPTPEIAQLREPDLKGTLFDSTGLIDAEEAYWLEIKSVAQFEIDGPFRRYTSELLSPVAKDVKKIWKDSRIFHGGLLLILFTENKEVGDHDINVWHTRCLDRGYPIGLPAVRNFPITNRIGNGHCHIGLFGVRGG